MNNQQQFKFIEGNFSTKESREVLQGVFSSKIQFHQMKNFSLHERFGKDDEIALNKITQLRKSIAEIISMIEFAEKEGLQLEIKSEIVINLISPANNV